MAGDYESKSPPLVMGNPDFQQAIAQLEEAEESDLDNNNPEEKIRWTNLSQWAFSEIPDTETEVEAIGEILGVKPLIKGEATESVIKRANRPQIIHIASHGFFQSSSTSQQQRFKENPLLLSGIVLAGFKSRETEQQREDGVLSALEVTGINLLGTKLVILSACDTGKGNISTGDGIYGLRRALVIAGAESQVISLWRVADASTKELMVSYYQRLKGGEGRSEALRQTQLEILEGRMEAMSAEKYQHPYYWAGFIASGNWRPMEWD
jgi:CHAT domain-containing protein